MSKNEKAVGAADESATAAPEPQMSLNEFCRRKSETVRRPELISGFEYTERVAGRTTGTGPEFEARYVTFLNKPV